jgi:hypothetical protein
MNKRIDTVRRVTRKETLITFSASAVGISLALETFGTLKADRFILIQLDKYNQTCMRWDTVISEAV